MKQGWKQLTFWKLGENVREEELNFDYKVTTLTRQVNAIHNFSLIMGYKINNCYYNYIRQAIEVQWDFGREIVS